MALPAIAGIIAVGAGTAILNYLNSEQGRRASAAERARLEELLAKIQTPNFKPEDLTFEEYQYVGTFSPQAAKYIEYARPEFATGESELAQVGLAPRTEALERLMQRSKTGRDLESDILMGEGTRQAMIAGKGQQEAILDAMRRQGRAGGGAELAAMLQSGQSAQGRAAQNTRAAALEAIRNRQESMLQAADLGGQIRSEAIGLEGEKADAINRFNENVTKSRQDYEYYLKDLANKAALREADMRQGIADRNVEGRNLLQRERQDVSQRNFENDMAKYRSQAGLSDVARSDIRDTTQQRAETIGGLGDMAQSAIAYGSRPEYKPMQYESPAPNEEEDFLTRYSMRNSPLSRRYSDA